MADTPKVTAARNNGQLPLASSSCGNLKFILENGEEILANSAIMCSNSPVIRTIALECGVTTFDVHDSKDAVEYFLGACLSGDLKAVPPSIFRDVNKLAHDYEVFKLAYHCSKCYRLMAKTVQENDFSTQRYLFDEAMYCSNELKKNEFFHVLKSRFTPKTTENFVTKYLINISSCSTEKLDAILDLTGKKEHIMVKVLINSIRLESWENCSLHANTRRILETLDFRNYPITHNPRYKILLELLEAIENPSKEYSGPIVKVLQQSVKRNDDIRNNSQNHIALPNLFLNFKPHLRYSSTLDEILMFLLESPCVSNSYIFYDAMETWLVNNRRRSLPYSTIGLFIAILREQIHSKKWRPLPGEYIISKSSSISGTLETKLLKCNDLTTNTEYRRLLSTLEYTSEQLFSVDHDIELAGHTEDPTFFLQVEAATSVKNNSFDVKLITDLMALHNKEFPTKNAHFTLDIRKEDGTGSKDVAVGWYDKPHRDGTGKYWCWGPHSFFSEGEGQPPDDNSDTKLFYWGSQAKIRPVVYFNFIYRGIILNQRSNNVD